MARRRSSSWLFKGLLAAGALLALALLAQTLASYRYVTESLIRQEAQRAAEARVRGFERAVRLAHVQDADAYQRLLDDYRDDVSDQIAAILVLRADGTVLAASGAPMAALAPEDRRAFLTTRAALPTSAQIGGQASLVGIFACRCAPPPRPDSRGDGSDRVFAQMAVYRDSLSAPFARLRRNAAVSAAAAIALLLALALLALRVGPYVRGKQLEGQLLLARQVQRALLPPSAAWPAGVDGGAVCVPAAQIGGDFYEVQQLTSGRLAFSLGDVSGHGISAALLMSMIHGAMGNGGGRAEDSPDQAVARLNGLLLKKSSGERFASMISCVYEPRTGRLGT